MPVPKKRQSKSRKNTRKFKWKQEPSKQTNKAISEGKIFLKQFLTENKSELLIEKKTEDNEKKTEDNEKKTEDNEKN